MESKKLENKINLNEILKDYRIKNTSVFRNYLTEIWEDLCQRSKDKAKGIEKLTFSKYYELPGIILERLFTVFDKKENDILDLSEFVQGMNSIFSEESSFDSLAKFIFEFYDFNKDGKINKEEVRIILSYVPLKNNNNTKINKGVMINDYKDRIDSQQEQLNQIIKTTFKDKEDLSFQEYIDVIKNDNSDIFILILIFLMENRPFNDETIKVYPVKITDSPSKKSGDIIQTIASPSNNAKYYSPSLKRRTMKLEFGGNILSLYSGEDSIKIKDDKKVKSKESKKEKENKKKIGEKKNVNIKERNKPQRRNPQKLSDLEDKTPKLSIFLEEKEKDKNNKENINEKKEVENNDEFEDEEMKPLIHYEGYMYKKSADLKKLKKVYFKLIGKDFYYFKSKDDNEHKGMHNLSGLFVQKGEELTFDGRKFYSISIIHPKKNKNYYFENETECNTWLEKIKLATENKSIFDFYTIKEKIGKGKFAVKHGVNKETGQSVAIKIISKKGLNKSDLELARTEIEILKITHHPYIIKLYDVYETADYIYIVMEYFNGGDLFSYIEKSDYKLPEKRACEIIHKLAVAVNYIHSYGIIHRDLKPENILMTDESDNADIRLLDFGLSKILGPEQTCTEPFGTLSFVAPEVLKCLPYSKSADLWSLGIITFLLLCGFLPFDDKYSEKEIARQTIEDKIPYAEKDWDNLSVEAKNFVDGLLKKNPLERLTIKEVLDHPWLKKFIKDPV